MEENTAMTAADVAANFAAGAVNEAKSILRIDEIRAYFTVGNVAHIVTSVAAILLFFAVYRAIREFLRRQAAKKLQEHTVDMISKAVGHVFSVLILLYVLDLFGINVTAIWGAAGIAGVALGFAAQTSVSNLISGFFVVSEKTMKLGDFIEIDGVSGTVDSIGLLSIKIHTLDNQMVRIPNSMIIDTKFMNYSAFPFRRYVCEVSVDFDTDVEAVMNLLLEEVPSLCPTVVKDKEEYRPMVYCMTVGERGINIQLVVWCARADIFQTRSDMCRSVVAVCRAHGVRLSHTRIDVAVKNVN